VTPRTLDAPTLRRTLLRRQLLLERASLPIPEAIDRVGGLQTQYSPSGYVGLWTRLAGFERDALTRALEDRSVIQATLLRVTIHMVSPAAYWPTALAVRAPRRAWVLKAWGLTQAEMQERAAQLREALRDGPKTVKELGPLGKGFIGNLGLWVDLVRVPPSGTWERRRADRLDLAERWVGPEVGDEPVGRAFLVRQYLEAFGPAAWKDIASWAGLSIADVKAAAEGLTLTTYRDEAGRPLVDIAGGTIAETGEPAPVRFLPHWDAALLVHARRTGLLPEAFRPRVFTSKNPFSVGTYLVDGVVAGAWSWRDGRIELDPYTELRSQDRKAVEREREALEAFHAG
jgi:hypothetical protein